MAYIDVNDIRQHFRGSSPVTTPSIQESIEEAESYVKLRLDMDPLPSNNNVVKDIIREITLAKVLLDMPNVGPDELARADLHRRNGLRMLNEADRHGIVPYNAGDRDVTKEVINRYEGPFWTQEDFLP